MESLSMAFFGSPPLQTTLKSHKPLAPKPISLLLKPHSHSHSSDNSPLSLPKPHRQWLVQTLAIIAATPLPSSAAEPVASPADQVVSGKISLEAILVAIDDFINRYPFFVAGCTFIWLIVIPLTEEYLRKYKFVYAIDAFRKLRDDPSAQLLDIRGGKSLKYLRSPNLKFLNDKSVVKVQFTEDDADGFVKKVSASFDDPGNTVLCILDDLDGNSLKAAELLVKSGFKEAYAIKGGVAGQKGWLEIQEQLLPPSVHILPRRKKKAKMPNELGKENGGVVPSSDDNAKAVARSSSPYPNYPDLKPPSSPTPSKPSK